MRRLDIAVRAMNYAARCLARLSPLAQAHDYT
jgi:hypothetical protein